MKTTTKLYHMTRGKQGSTTTGEPTYTLYGHEDINCDESGCAAAGELELGPVHPADIYYDADQAYARITGDHVLLIEGVAETVHELFVGTKE